MTTIEPQDNKLLQQAIDLICKDYAHTDSISDAEFAFTTEDIQAKIKAFMGVNIPIIDVYFAMVQAGHQAKMTDSVELGLTPNFYWFIKKK
jgi:hypothetical protein